MLSGFQTNFKIIGITESRLTTKRDLTSSIDMSDYNMEHIPTKSDEGALLYIAKKLNYKNRNNLKLYEDKNLESVFTEMLSKFDKITITGCT